VTKVTLHVDTALHFTFFQRQTKVHSIIMMESLQFYVFFLVCYFFTKKAAQLLTVTGGPNTIPAPVVSTHSVEYLSTRLKSVDDPV
jgi:hypothetical protein